MVNGRTHVAPPKVEEKEVFVRTTPEIAGEVCDACGGQSVAARYEATLGEQKLFFCAHHIRRFADKLQSTGFAINPEDISYTAGVSK